MADLRQAAQQAVEFLEKTGDLWWNSKDEAITAITAALKQAVPYAVWRQGPDAVRKYKENNHD
jgi:hypothetical protein